jgi:hypothetical protein
VAWLLSTRPSAAFAPRIPAAAWSRIAVLLHSFSTSATTRWTSSTTGTRTRHIADSSSGSSRARKNSSPRDASSDHCRHVRSVSDHNDELRQTPATACGANGSFPRLRLPLILRDHPAGEFANRGSRGWDEPHRPDPGWDLSLVRSQVRPSSTCRDFSSSCVSATTLGGSDGSAVAAKPSSATAPKPCASKRSRASRRWSRP